MHAYGAAFDNPGLIVACVVGDGEAETGPLATSWHSNKFLDPVHDGAVLPILHLNGYKIANPTVLARIPEPELVQLLEGYGHAPHRRRRRPREGPPAAGRDARPGARRDRRDPGRGQDARRRAGRAAALADDRAPDTQGLDRPEGRRWRPGRGHVALPPGAGRGRARQRGPPGRARGVAALVPARGALRRRRRPRPGARGAAATGRPADERQPARQRRPAAAGPQAARFPATP